MKYSKMENQPKKNEYDYLIIGSGFGGSVSALRLSEKGCKVLVIEKGKWFKAEDFPKTNWNLKKWLWLPALRFFGFFKMTLFRHVSILSGVGVGGGSLVYANTLPVPKKEFFRSGSWRHLADWERELQPFYETALEMLGATPNPRLEVGDLALKQLGSEIGRESHFRPAQVSVYFGEPGKTVEDPYFKGKGPLRTGCIFCGGCMTGCRYNSKNSLDKNYLHLAQQLGAEIKAEAEVLDVVPHGKEDGSEGYRVQFRSSTKIWKRKSFVTAKGIVFSGGVLGTVKLLLKLRKSSLPRLSPKVGSHVRTNNESLILVTSFDKKKDFSRGVAIGSILHTDAHTHIEPVRYGKGSGFWRLSVLPMVFGKNVFIRAAKIFADWLRRPLQNLKLLFVDDFAQRTQIILFMQQLDSTLSFSRSLFGRMATSVEKGKKPTAFIPRAGELARKYSRLLNAKPQVFSLEPLLGIPSTAHILGGAVMGKDSSEGVIDKDNRVFGYENMFVCDGSMISANPGVNPSLTITAISERAMDKVASR